MTSTVKKPNPNKSDLHKKHFENIINEQSAIQEEEPSTTREGQGAMPEQHKNGAGRTSENHNHQDDTLNAESDAENNVKQHVKNVNVNQNEDYRCKIIYFLKDCSQVCRFGSSSSYS